MISILLLSLPLIWELWNDRNGDSHISRGFIKLPSKKVDVIVRVILAFLVSLINYILYDKEIIKSISLSGAIHFLCFDYLIAYILIKRKIIKGKWWSYMGSKGMDNIKLWKNIKPQYKFLIRLTIFVTILIFYLN